MRPEGPEKNADFEDGIGVPAPRDRLSSWKEIATFLDCDERTAMRREALGMPVHRIPGGKKGRVYASRSEISAWLRGRSGVAQEPGPQPRGDLVGTSAPVVTRAAAPRKYVITALGTGAIVVLLTIGTILMSRTAQLALPTRVQFTDRSVQAFDDGGRRVWAHSFGRPLLLDWRVRPINRTLDHFVRVGDFLGDGGREVLVVAPLRSGPNPSDDTTFEIDCFSSGGALLWSYVPRDTFTFGEHEMKGPWNIYDVMVSHQGAQRSIWVLAVHRDWGTSFVVELDPRTGRGPVRFVNSGVLYTLQELRTSRGMFLIAGGFNNEYESGALAVIDEARTFAASPQTPRTPHECLSCPKGNPNYYFVFPRSEINRVEKEWLDAVGPVAVTDDDIQVSKIERGDHPVVQTLYLLRLTPSAHAVSVRYSAEYDLEHRALQQAGRINHALDDCPERLRPLPIRMWRPAAGWTELPLKPINPTSR
jgi:hypothetical protein